MTNKVKPFYIKITDDMTPQMVQDAFDKCRELGVKDTELCDSLDFSHWVYFGVCGRDGLYCSDYHDNFHGDAKEITLDQLDEWFGIAGGSPKQTEWNGEGLPPVGVECEFTPDNTLWGFNYIESFAGVVLHYEGEQFVFMLKHEKYKLESGMIVVSRTDKGEFSKPETPEQKAERERIENGKAIYDLMSSIEMNHDIAGTPNKWAELRDEWQSVYIQLAESVGYRKQ